MSAQSVGDSPPATLESAQESALTATELPLDEVFDVLSNERRRMVLLYLLMESEATTLGELAEHIASIENDKTENALSSSERKRVYICLYQSHLPKMDDLNVIDFDEDSKAVEVGENFDQATRFLPQGSSSEPASSAEKWITVVMGWGNAIRSRLPIG